MQKTPEKLYALIYKKNLEKPPLEPALTQNTENKIFPKKIIKLMLSLYTTVRQRQLNFLLYGPNQP